jgi:hypothetical protein
LHGEVLDDTGARVPAALVTWLSATLVTDSVLSDEDGEFTLPLRRAPRGTALDVRAERPAPPPGGKSGDIIVRVPQDLTTFQTIQIL